VATGEEANVGTGTDYILNRPSLRSRSKPRCPVRMRRKVSFNGESQGGNRACVNQYSPPKGMDIDLERLLKEE
jgi:hypothetical protein